jgi:hypothetical protein
VAFFTPPRNTEPFDIVIVEAKATRSTPAQVVEESWATYHAKFQLERGIPIAVSCLDAANMVCQRW